MQPDRLALSLQKLESLSVDAHTRRAIAEVLKAASNPNAERIDVIVKALPQERRTMIEKTASRVRGVTNDVTARGRAGLMELSDEQWERLLDE